MTEAGGPAPPQPAGDVLDTPEAGPRVIRGSVLRTAGYVAGMGVGVVGAALMTRHLGPADFGRFITVTSLIRIVAGFTEAGMTTIGIREYSTRKGAERDGLMANLLGLRIPLTAAGVGVAVLFAAAAVGLRPISKECDSGSHDDCADWWPSAMGGVGERLGCQCECHAATAW